MSIELKPCPFCGFAAHPLPVLKDNKPVVQCVGCGVLQLEEKWNTRHEAAKVAGQPEKCPDCEEEIGFGAEAHHECARQPDDCAHDWWFKGTTGHGSSPDCYECKKCKEQKWE